MVSSLLSSPIQPDEKVKNPRRPAWVTRVLYDTGE
jgi:hypothetical protein